MDNFLGEVRLFAGTFAPVGWAFCDGSLQSIAENTELYSLIGTTYGGDGTTTFALPDLRGRVPVHQNGGTYVPGMPGGLESVALLASNLSPHNHLLLASTSAQTTSTPTGALLAAAPANLFAYRETPGTVALNSASVGNTGGGAGHENRQPYQAVNYIIATSGIWPSQN